MAVFSVTKSNFFLIIKNALDLKVKLINKNKSFKFPIIMTVKTTTMEMNMLGTVLIRL